MTLRRFAAVLSLAATAAFATAASAAPASAGQRPRFDQCRKGGRPSMICNHAAGRAGVQLQVLACNEGRQLVTLAAPGADDRMAQTDALEVREMPAPSKAGGPIAWVNQPRSFELLVNFTTKPVNGGHAGSFHFGRGPSTAVVCSKLR